MTESPRRIVGNLDCEVELAREAALERDGSKKKAGRTLDTRFALPGAVEASISAFATLLRAFAREGDRIWTPRPVDAQRMAGAPGLPGPELESGPIENIASHGSLLAWAETPAVEALRAPDSRTGAPPCAGQHELDDLAWKLPAPRGHAVRRANHRGFCLEIAQQLGCALPGARSVGSVGELETHLASGGALGARGERWVVKAPLSAAGRSRVLGDGRSIDPGASRRVERLLELHGELIFEPWMERTADFGCCALVGSGEPRLLPPHRLAVDPRGGFRGIGLGAGSGDASLREDERGVLLETTRSVAQALRAVGYAGPFGIDCWRYRDARGETRFHPLGEINARMSFGLVARALVERLTRAGAIAAGDDALLRLGKGDELAARQAAGARVIALLLPSPFEPSAAWIEIDATRG